MTNRLWKLLLPSDQHADKKQNGTPGSPRNAATTSPRADKIKNPKNDVILHQHDVIVSGSTPAPSLPLTTKIVPIVASTNSMSKDIEVMEYQEVKI
jgi:hypothetical protein